MNNRSDAEQWHEMARHLVQAHGAEPGGPMVYAPTLEQLRFAHADTHIALASIKALPPDRHTHPLPMAAGWFDRRESSYRPFSPSASARADPFCFPCPHQTGLPHTCVLPRHEADLADWAAGRPSDDTPADSIRNSAARAAAAWRARASCPSPVPTRPSIQPGCSATRTQQELAAENFPRRPAVGPHLSSGIEDFLGCGTGSTARRSAESPGIGGSTARTARQGQPRGQR
jgi:hypothetical protein